MKTKILLAALAISVCAALAVAISAKVSSHRVPSLAVENVEALSECEIIPLGPGWYIITGMLNRPEGGCVAGDGVCELRGPAESNFQYV